MIALLFLAATVVAAQDKSTVTVKNAETASGVVIVNVVQPATADQAKGTFELHCNKGAAFCKTPEPGSYQMVRLPKNWGMYDCANVDLYAEGANPTTDQKVGEYCINEK
jgi:hypothetical protein